MPKDNNPKKDLGPHKKITVLVIKRLRSGDSSISVLKAQLSASDSGEDFCVSPLKISPPRQVKFEVKKKDNPEVKSESSR